VRAASARRFNAVLSLLVAQDGLPDSETYRRQLERAQVSGECSCGCATIDLTVPDDLPRAAFKGSPLLPIEAHGSDPNHPEIPIEIILFAPEGVLKSLEIVYYGETPPRSFPSPATLKVVRRE
jgi:hypothetical protein